MKNLLFSFLAFVFFYQAEAQVKNNSAKYTVYFTYGLDKSIPSFYTEKHLDNFRFLLKTTTDSLIAETKRLDKKYNLQLIYGDNSVPHNEQDYAFTFHTYIHYYHPKPTKRRTLNDTVPYLLLGYAVKPSFDKIGDFGLNIVGFYIDSLYSGDIAESHALSIPKLGLMNCHTMIDTTLATPDFNQPAEDPHAVVALYPLKGKNKKVTRNLTNLMNKIIQSRIWSETFLGGKPINEFLYYPIRKKSDLKKIKQDVTLYVEGEVIEDKEGYSIRLKYKDKNMKQLPADEKYTTLFRIGLEEYKKRYFYELSMRMYQSLSNLSLYNSSN